MYLCTIKSLLCWAFIVLCPALSQAMQLDSQIEVAFFNVGQGNCTVVKSPDRKEVWIIDAGSKKNPYNQIDNRSFTRQNVATAIGKWVGRSEDLTFHVILSHPDEDHYNIIPTIRYNYPKHKFIYYISNKYEPGRYGASTFKDSEGNNVDDTDIKRIKYTSADLPEVEVKEPEHKKRRKKLDEEETGDKYSIKNGSGAEEYIIEFLNAGVIGKSGGQQNTNLHSLIIKVIYGQHSVLLTGDATAHTYEDVERHPLADEMQNVTILQSSHHGASSEGSNSKHFIEYINPHYVVFSAPAYSSYDHPNNHVVEKYAKFFQSSAKVLEDHFHFFFLNKNITPLEMNYNLFNDHGGVFKPILTYRQNPQDQVEDLGIHVVALTNYPIFHTGSHGTIIFNWTFDGEVKFDTYDYDQGGIISAEEGVSALTNTTDTIFLNLKQIDVALIKMALAREYACLGVKLHNVFTNLVQHIDSPCFSKLQAIYIEKNTSIDPINHDLLKEILHKLPHLQIFSILKEMLHPEYQPSVTECRFLGLPIS